MLGWDPALCPRQGALELKTADSPLPASAGWPLHLTRSQPLLLLYFQSTPSSLVSPGTISRCGLLLFPTVLYVAPQLENKFLLWLERGLCSQSSQKHKKVLSVENQAVLRGYLGFFSPPSLQRNFLFEEKGDWELQGGYSTHCILWDPIITSFHY